jgi:two-component system, NarL family, nitrate/nitrite response regulator NarL
VNNQLESAPLRILLVEDHPIVAQGLMALLAEGSEFHVVGWAQSVADATRIAEQEQIDVAIVDLWLAHESGAMAVAGIRKHRPAVAVVFLSGDESDHALLEAIQAGASGYLVKSADGLDIADAVRRVADGEMLIPGRKLGELLKRHRELERHDTKRVQQLESLTPREREILDLMSQGLDNREIAARLHVAYPTVRSHVRKVLEKLDARSRLEAVVKAAGGTDSPAD